MIRLKRMRALIGYERRLHIDYARAMSNATKITTTITGMPHGSGTESRTETGAIELAEVEAAYKEILEELRAMREELAPLIASLKNPDDIAIMRLRYIDGKALQDIQAAIHVSERAMFYHLSGAESELIRRYPGKVSMT